jgi:hypothetical protein
LHIKDMADRRAPNAMQLSTTSNYDNFHQQRIDDDTLRLETKIKQIYKKMVEFKKNLAADRLTRV